MSCDVSDASPRHSLGSSLAANQTPVFLAFYQTVLCRTFHKYLEKKKKQFIFNFQARELGNKNELMQWNCLHFPLNTAMRGLYFFNFSVRILPPSRNSLLLDKLKKGNIRKTTQLDLKAIIWWSFTTTMPLNTSPAEVFTSWCRPLHHVGEAHLVLGWQGGVMHVVELLFSKSRQK